MPESSSYELSLQQGGLRHQLPCRFSELDTDSRLRQAVRWTLERLQADLVFCAGSDSVSLSLLALITQLMQHVLDVPARRPQRGDLESAGNGGALATLVLREGLRAMSWIVDERGLGGGRTSDGLAWMLSLEELWERYVEHIVREDAARTGGKVRIGRLRETTVPLAWSGASHRALGHLVPDFVVHRPDSIEIVDAKYKLHFADLDATRWSTLAEETQNSMRADIHQVLAYAATTGFAKNIGATLIYPVPHALYEELNLSRRTESIARIPVGTTEVTLRIRAAAFA